MIVSTHPSAPAKRIQVWILLLLSVLIIFGAPNVLNYTPDSGIYIGSALSLVEDGRYWFNGHPNLLYYPGTSVLLTLPIALFGLNFHVMHISFALLAVATLWLARACFPAERYGWTGLLLPLLLGANRLFQTHTQLIVSDIAFLDLVLLALYFWRQFEATEQQRWFLACALVVAMSSMFRFHGLFLTGAFGLSVLAYVYRHRDLGWAFVSRHLGIAALVLLPFILWTFRNYQLHTADTYNMANKAFFGLSGLKISGEGFGTVDWIDADWKYPVYQLMYIFGRLGNTFLGELGDYLPMEFVAAGVLGLIFAGGWTWVRRAGAFEAAFVLTAGAMLVHQFVGGKSLYFVTRYWLPLLPFFILIAGLGIQRIGEILVSSRYRKAVAGGAIAITLVILASGVLGWADILSTQNTERIARRYDTAITVASYVKNNLPEDTVILGTDWGVTPMLTRRRSYSYLRSSCHKRTLERIRDKTPSHLVVLAHSLTTPMALDMADQYPQAFQPVFSVGDRERRSFGAVYTIDQKQVLAIISSIQCQSRK